MSPLGHGTVAPFPVIETGPPGLEDPAASQREGRRNGASRKSQTPAAGFVAQRPDPQVEAKIRGAYRLSFDAEDLLQFMHDLDEIALRRDDRLDRLVGAWCLVDDALVLAAFNTGRRGAVIFEREPPFSFAS